MKQREKGKPFGRTFPLNTKNGNLRITGLSLNNAEDSTCKNIKPATPTVPIFPSVSTSVKINKRPHRLFSEVNNSQNEPENMEMTPCGSIILRTISDGKIEASRTRNERDHNPDRLSLDRRGLTTLPILIGETKLRLLSLQHNLLTKLERTSLQCLSHLVFLDVYNNQLESISPLDCLTNLRVLLLGKNRIRFIEGLDNLGRLEVLDLHGNQIFKINGLIGLKELKVLNLAGNEIKTIDSADLKGLCSLQELNLRRNRIKQILGFDETSLLSKLFLSNNEITVIRDIENLKNLRNLKEITLDGNPINTSEECILFIVSYIPSVHSFDQMFVTEDIRKSAHIWKMKQEFLNKNSTYNTSLEIDNFNNHSTGTRTRSASENRISYLRKLSSSLEQNKNRGSTQCVNKLTRIYPKSARVPNKMLRRNNFTKQRTFSGESYNESESNLDFTHLPPIQSPLLNNLDDNCSSTVGIRNDTNTSLESNKSSRSICCDSYTGLDTVICDSCSSTDEESVIGEESMCHEELKLIKPIPMSETRAKLTENTVKNSRVRLYRNICNTTTPVKTKSAVTRKLSKNKKPEQKDKIQERGEDYLVEIAGRFLNVTGKNSAKFIDRLWSLEKSCDVTTVRFNCVCFNSLVPVFNKIKPRFQNAEHFVFTDTNIMCLGQLNALADIQGLTSLCIDTSGNPVTTKDWQTYAIYRLNHWGLRYINNALVTEEQIEQACDEFKGLSDIVLWSLPDALLTPLLSKLQMEVNENVSPKQWLYKADAALRDVICKEALQWRSPSSLNQEKNRRWWQTELYTGQSVVTVENSLLNHLRGDKENGQFQNFMRIPSTDSLINLIGTKIAKIESVLREPISIQERLANEVLLRENGRESLNKMMETVCSVITKLRILENDWHLILRKIVHNILHDYSDMKSYIKMHKSNLKPP